MEEHCSTSNIYHASTDTATNTITKQKTLLNIRKSGKIIRINKSS